MKKAVALIMVALLAVTSLFAQGSGEKTEKAAKPFEIVIGHIVDENNTWHLASLKFKEIVEQESAGRIKVTVYPNNQLGSEIEVIQSILTGGGADITFTGESMQTYSEELGIIGMPYAITSDAQMERLLDGEVGQELESLMLKGGMRVLGAFTRGPRNITSNKPINSPSDLRGFIIRTPQSPMTVAAFQSMGAKPTPMAFGEVFTSLQQGVIDGQENPLAMIKTGGFSEVQKYVNVTEHLRAWVYIAMGEAKFQSLPADLQQIVLDAGKEMEAYEHELYLAEENQLKEQLIAAGMQFVAVDQAPFVEKAIAGVLPVLTPKQRALYEKITALK
ncbi:MAG: TRAP transporter substrate-binding protein [Sphaerochaeta sp.]|nr:TRAP transporter substrate-binding protein [Sphaerochaeta sp.]